MNDDLQDINIFNQGFEHLKKAIECFREVSDELVTIEEFRQLESYLNNELTDRKIQRENDLESWRFEVC